MSFESANYFDAKLPKLLDSKSQESSGNRFSGGGTEAADKLNERYAQAPISRDD